MPCPPHPSRFRYYVKLLIATLVLLAIGAAGLWLLRVPILTGLADLWITSELPQKADAILILGGGLETRPQAAAELYRRGFAPLVVYADQEWKLRRVLVCDQSAGEMERRILVAQGVPESAIKMIGHEATSTWDECVSVRDWARTNGVKRLLLVTDVFHTRRCRWLFRKQLKPVGIEVLTVGVTNPWYSATNWWNSEEGLLAFQNEVVKLMYYHFKY